MASVSSSRCFTNMLSGRVEQASELLVEGEIVDRLSVSHFPLDRM